MDGGCRRGCCAAAALCLWLPVCAGLHAVREVEEGKKREKKERENKRKRKEMENFLNLEIFKVEK
jgi:hypothetical protein